jgi:hypothetical protein
MHLKHLILCLLLLFVGKNSNEEPLTWDHSQKLTWEDFKAKSDENSDAIALTASGITFGYSVKTSDKRIVDFSTSVEAHFYPNQSWYVKEKCDNHVLRHEQLHFDITELYARKFKEQLILLVVNRNIKDQMNRLHTTINKALNETQKRYDGESNHSINIEMQKQWEIFIANELKTLDQFKPQ